jgi:hypothetical protein
MKLSATALASLMFCLALAGCNEKIVAPIKPPPQRLVCEAAGERPKIPAEYQIDWSKVQTVQQARSEHDAYVRSIRTREGIVAGYIVTLEGKHFICFNNAQWQRDFWAKLPDG